MKSLILFCSLNCIAFTGFTSFANNLTINHNSYSYLLKVREIDSELKNAKSFTDIRTALKSIAHLVFSEPGDTCKPPKDSDYRLICGDLVTKSKVPGDEAEFYEYIYEKRLLHMACVNIGIDSEEIVKKKVQAWWEKYKTKCKCDSITFNVPNGSLLKFAISQSQPEFIDILVFNYNLDINFVDPADGRTDLDYLNDQIEILKGDGSSQGTIDIYEKYKRNLITLGAKPSK